MGNELNKIASTDAGVSRTATRALQLKDFDRLFGVRDDINAEDRKDIAEDWWKWTEEVRLALSNLRRFANLLTSTAAAETPHIAWQHVQITAAMLESSDDPDGNPVVRSVLTTDGLQDSNYQFNWMRAGGLSYYKVVLGPGSGVPSHDVIIDRDDANVKMAKFEAVGDASIMTSANVARPYGLEGLRLQFGEWRPAGSKFEFWPSSIAVGTFCYLEQQLAMRNYP